MRAVHVKSYLLTTGVIFALIVVAHVLRIMAEGPKLLLQPVFALTSMLSVALALWAWRLFRRLPRSRD